MNRLEMRKFVGELLRNVLLGKLPVSKAARMFPKDFDDRTLEAAFHALIHYEADEDLRKKDALYAQEQDEYISLISDTLLTGEDLPQNIIAEYNEYYSEAPLYKKESKENFLKRLKKFINL